MRRDKTKALLSMIAIMATAGLTMIFWLFPITADSHPLHVLLIDCIPDAVVVLIAIPVVYWLLYRRGLSNMGDCPLFTSHHAAAGTIRLPISSKKLSKPTGDNADEGVVGSHEGPRPQEVLVVIDSGRDLLKDSHMPADIKTSLKALNAAIRAAEAGGMPVIFAEAPCLSADSADEGRDDGPAACAEPAMTRSSGNLWQPAGSGLLNLGDSSRPISLVAQENPAWDVVFSNPRIHTVYIAGIARPHVLQAVCRDILRRGKKAVVAEATMVVAGENSQQTEQMWHECITDGLARIDRLPLSADEQPRSAAVV